MVRAGGSELDAQWCPVWPGHQAQGGGEDQPALTGLGAAEGTGMSSLTPRFPHGECEDVVGREEVGGSCRAGSEAGGLLPPMGAAGGPTRGSSRGWGGTMTMYSETSTPPPTEPGCLDALCRVHMTWAGGTHTWWEYRRLQRLLEIRAERKGLSTYGEGLLRQEGRECGPHTSWAEHQQGQGHRSWVLFVTGWGQLTRQDLGLEVNPRVSFFLKGPTPDSALW